MDCRAWLSKGQCTSTTLASLFARIAQMLPRSLVSTGLETFALVELVHFMQVATLTILVQAAVCDSSYQQG